MSLPTVVGIAAAVAGVLYMKKKHDNRPRNVVALGTSITVPPWAYTQRLQELLPPGSSTKNFGHGGKGVQTIRRTMDEALQLHPTDVILETLVNDIAGYRTLEHMSGHTNEMLRKAKAAGATTHFLVLVPLKKADWAEGRDMMRRWAESNPLIDNVIIPNEMFMDNGRFKPAYTRDQVHPTKEGQRKLGEIIAKALR
jgi:lysophospholipase L1-like esterase